MKRNFPLVVIFLSISLHLISNKSLAQWYPFDKRNPTAPFLNSALIVSGSNIVTGNALTTGTSYSIYFTPDTSTVFTASSSNMGGGASNEIPLNIVMCQGSLFTMNQNAVYINHDGGETWGKTTLTDTSYISGKASYIWSDGTDLWAIAPPKVFKSSDAGANWTTFTFNKIDSKVSAFYNYKGVIYTGGKSGIIYSPDNGVTWDTAKTPSTLIGASTFGFALFHGNIYAATSNGIYMETDSGANWTQVFSKNTISITPVGSLLLAGTGSPYDGIYKCDSTGKSWTQINTGLDYSAGYPVLGTISTNGGFIVAGVTDSGSFTSTLSNTIYVSTLSALGIPAGVNTINKPAAEVLLYPNPTTNNATLFLNEVFGKEIKVTMCDMAGKTISTGNYHNTSIIKIDLSKVPAGVYSLHIGDGQNAVTKKLIVQ